MNYDYEEVVPYLLKWFDYNARILAWRENPKPYYVWVSEIMLQQTRVEAVKSYFDRFIQKLPDIKALAEVEEEQLLKLWEGLGYYNRVRNLQKAARVIMEQYNGVVPADYEALLKLPGIGSYTAGAISSIAFQIPVPAVDGNVLRVTKRISGSYDDITKESVKKELWQDLITIMPKDRPGDFNQSLMELGATVCLPNGKPLCDQCPVMHLCKAFQKDIVMELPVKPSKKDRRIEEKTILLMEYENNYAIRKREKKGLLAGLWEIPSLEGRQSLAKVTKELEKLGIRIKAAKPLKDAKHIFSHIEWHMIGYHIKVEQVQEEVLKEKAEYIWASKDDMKDIYTLPSAFSSYAAVWSNEG